MSSMRAITAVAWVAFALIITTLALVATTLAIVATRPGVRGGNGSGSGNGNGNGGSGSQPQLAGGLGGALNPARIDGPLAGFPAKGERSAALVLKGAPGASLPTITARLPGKAGHGAALAAIDPSSTSTNAVVLRTVDARGAEALVNAPQKSVVYVVQSSCPACVRVKALLQALTTRGSTLPPLPQIALLDVRDAQAVAHLFSAQAVPQAFVVGGGKVERGQAGAPPTESQLVQYLQAAVAAG